MDGSENSETLPLRPLTIPKRKLDFIIAYDSSGEEVTDSWVNGTTFARSALGAKQLGYPFPNVPDATTFVNLELNKYPVSPDCLGDFRDNIANHARLLRPSSGATSHLLPPFRPIRHWSSTYPMLRGLHTATIASAQRSSATGS